MPKPDLKKFFNPASVALVGATDDLCRFAGKVLMRMTDFGYAGKIYPVNPRFKGQKVRGRECYASVRDLPEAPDHVGVVVPAAHVLGILEDCAARGARFVTVYTGGFAESGTAEGRALQAEVVALARRSGMRIMGPNCNGMISFVDAFAMTTSATIAGPRRPAGNVGVVVAKRRRRPGQRDVARAGGRRRHQLPGELRQLGRPQHHRLHRVHARRSGDRRHHDAGRAYSGRPALHGNGAPRGRR